jgi:RNA polymerase sigma factor (sigma-70 family)
VSDDLADFRLLFDRVRAGEEAAVVALVQRFERIVRAAVRVRLTDPALRRQFDSMDIVQSVMANFLRQAADGEYQIDGPGQLAGLLLTMARRKLRQRERDAHRQRRDIDLVHPTMDPDVTATPQPGPGTIVEGRDGIERLLARLSSDERDIMLRRAAGESWDEIATALGGTAEARRKQLRRAIDIATGEDRP